LAFSVVLGLVAASGLRSGPEGNDS
jgi:hypothetical protein